MYDYSGQDSNFRFNDDDGDSDGSIFLHVIIKYDIKWNKITPFFATFLVINNMTWSVLNNDSEHIQTFLSRRFLTHWGRDKIDAILQTAFSNAIS